MPTGVRSQSENATKSPHPTRPEISVCESCPGKVVFMEAENTDGWIASDVTTELQK